MTVRILRPCNYPNCRKYAEKGSYCMEHYLLKEHERQNAKKRKRYKGSLAYNNSRWYVARTQYLIANPLCVICGNPATEVDEAKSGHTAACYLIKLNRADVCITLTVCLKYVHESVRRSGFILSISQVDLSGKKRITSVSSERYREADLE